MVVGKVMKNGEMINVATQQHLDALGYRSFFTRPPR